MSQQDEKAEFFVGYLEAPAGISQFYKIIIPVLLLCGIGFSFWISSSQSSAGEGVWDLSGEVEISGYLTVDPYPVIHIAGEQPRSVILVEQTKMGAGESAGPYANQWVSVSGFAITRGDWTMLQLVPSSTFSVLADAGSAPIASVDMGEVELTGEIIDSKCFLGVMKPGAGKAHRACASMCLRGGIPPLLVVKNAEGEKYGFMLMNEDGSSASIELAQQVAVPVTLSGRMEKRGDMMYIRYKENSVVRLSGTSLLSYGESLAYN